MLVAVISDTHRVGKYIELVKEKISNADVLIHLGDNTDDVRELTEGFKGKVYAVSGNCDYSNDYPDQIIIEIEGVKILATHGHIYNVKNSLNSIYYKAKEAGVDIALFGHTHVEMILNEEGLILMNPGSVSLPRGKGRYIGLIEIEKDKDTKVYLEELI